MDLPRADPCGHRCWPLQGILILLSGCAAFQDQDFRAGRELSSRGEFDKAKDAYARVLPGSPKYEAAQLSIPSCDLRVAEAAWAAYGKAKDETVRVKALSAFQAAVHGYQSYLNRVPPRTGDRVQRDNRMAARYFLAKIYLHDAVRSPERAINVLDRYEIDFAKPSEFIRVVHALDLRIQALLERGDCDAAERTATSLKSRGADERLMSRIWYRLASFCEERSESERLNPGQDLSFSRKATEYYGLWLTTLPDATADQIETLGNRYFALGKSEQDPAAYARAASLYRSAAERYGRGESKRQKLEWRAAQADRGQGGSEQTMPNVEPRK